MFPPIDAPFPPSNRVEHNQKLKGEHIDNGGGSRTRTYEGLASGFTVRPLCRSGHSPIALH